jgi:hypothetical protein
MGTSLSSSRRLVRPLLLGLVLAAFPAANTATAPAASATVCETRWGSLAEHRAPFTTRQVTDVRSGRHQCFDRLVVEIDGRGKGRPGYQVKYVRRVERGGSGSVVRLRGDAKIRVIIKAPAYDDEGHVTYDPARPRELADVTGYDTFRQIAWAGSYEGQTVIGLGVRARLPMRVFVLDDPGGRYRIVVDVAHHWE